DQRGSVEAGPAAPRGPGAVAGGESGGRGRVGHPAPTGAGRSARGGGDPVLPRPRREASEPDVLARRVASGSAPAFRIRRSGDTHLLVEAGPPELDLSVRMWIHMLAGALRAAGPRGVTEIVEGVRSLLVAVDGSVLTLPRLAGLLVELSGRLD